ncbi:unnamed protein product [uncultured bacterium]|nr:unnamed protein product [uncultured bacterium]
MPCALYGIPADHLDAVAQRLGVALAWTFERRESSFWGPYSLHEGPDGGEIRIYYNEDPMYDSDSDPPQEQYFEPDHHAYRVLVDAQLLSEGWLHCLGEAVRSEFPGSVLIRRRDA